MGTTGYCGASHTVAHQSMSNSSARLAFHIAPSILPVKSLYAKRMSRVELMRLWLPLLIQ